MSRRSSTSACTGSSASRSAQKPGVARGALGAWASHAGARLQLDHGTKVELDSPRTKQARTLAEYEALVRAEKEVAAEREPKPKLKRRIPLNRTYFNLAPRRNIALDREKEMLDAKRRQGPTPDRIVHRERPWRDNDAPKKSAVFSNAYMWAHMNRQYARWSEHHAYTDTGDDDLMVPITALMKGTERTGSTSPLRADAATPAVKRPRTATQRQPPSLSALGLPPSRSASPFPDGEKFEGAPYEKEPRVSPHRAKRDKVRSRPQSAPLVSSTNADVGLSQTLGSSVAPDQSNTMLSALSQFAKSGLAHQMRTEKKTTGTSRLGSQLPLRSGSAGPRRLHCSVDFARSAESPHRTNPAVEVRPTTASSLMNRQRHVTSIQYRQHVLEQKNRVWERMFRLPYDPLTKTTIGQE